MAVYEHLTTFAGLPVVDAQYETWDGAPDAVAWRVAVDYEDETEDFEQCLQGLLAQVGAESIRALLVGQWGSAYEQSAPVSLLAGLADRLVNLRALFLGEMVSEECEISWIQQEDVTPLLRAYPGLEVLRVRGGTGLDLEPVRHENLRELALETGGLAGAVVRAVGACDLPQLRRLELWLGTAQYGGDSIAEDLAGVLAGNGMPQVRYLGLRDAEIADQVAAAVAAAPVVARLEELDLSMGALTDDGLLALLGGQPLTHLRRLDLSHHFLSEDLAARVPAQLPGVEVDLSDRQTEEEWGRYVAVSE